MASEKHLHALTAAKNLFIQAGNSAGASSVSITAPAANGLWIYYLAVSIWGAGVLIMLLASFQASWRMQRKLADATRLQDRVFETDAVAVPFVFGLIKPRIILPVGLTEDAAAHVLHHERVHIRRMDHIVRPLAFVLLAIHWFNPFIWLAFMLMGKDMETSCDERALRGYDEKGRIAYCETLLKLAEDRSHGLSARLGFGEGSVRSRISQILFAKKPILVVMILFALMISFAGFSLITDPPAASNPYYEEHKAYAEFFGPALFSTLTYKASESEINTVAPILATAKNVFRHTGGMSLMDQDVVALSRYYYPFNSYWDIEKSAGNWKVTSIIEHP